MQNDQANFNQNKAYWQLNLTVERKCSYFYLIADTNSQFSHHYNLQGLVKSLRPSGRPLGNLESVNSTQWELPLARLTYSDHISFHSNRNSKVIPRRSAQRPSSARRKASNFCLLVKTKQLNIACWNFLLNWSLHITPYWEPNILCVDHFPFNCTTNQMFMILNWPINFPAVQADGQMGESIIQQVNQMSRRMCVIEYCSLEFAHAAKHVPFSDFSSDELGLDFYSKFISWNSQILSQIIKY